jgi:hypothetical protein
MPSLTVTSDPMAQARPYTARCRSVIDNGIVGGTNEGSTLVSRFIASTFQFADPDTRPY